MPMLVEAAIVTRKAKGETYNTDSINASGKTWPRERIHSDGGVFAAGRGQLTPYYVLSSSNSMGTAESAVQLYNECASSFDEDCSNVSEMTAEFFRSFISFLGSETGQNSASCTIAAFIGHGNRVYLAKSGRTKLFRIADDKVSEVVPQLFEHTDLKSQYGVCSFPEVNPGEIYLLLSSGVSAALSNDIIEKACKQCDGDVQKLLRKLANATVAADAGVSVTLMAIKVLQTESLNVPESNVAAAPVEAAAFVAAASAKAAVLGKNDTDNAKTQADSEQNLNDEVPSGEAVVYANEDDEPLQTSNDNTQEAEPAEQDSDLLVNEGENAENENQSNSDEATTDDKATEEYAVNGEGDVYSEDDLPKDAEQEEADLNSKKRYAVIALAVALTVALLVLVFLVVRGLSERLGTAEDVSTAETTTTESDVLTTKAAEVGTASEQTTVSETTTVAAERTTARTENVTRAPNNETQTNAPQTEPENTTAPAQTEASTEAPTEAPTDTSTEAPTEAPTDVPTEAPTEAQTLAPLPPQETALPE